MKEVFYWMIKIILSCEKRSRLSSGTSNAICNWQRPFGDYKLVTLICFSGVSSGLRLPSWRSWRYSDLVSGSNPGSKSGFSSQTLFPLTQARIQVCCGWSLRVPRSDLDRISVCQLTSSFLSLNLNSIVPFLIRTHYLSIMLRGCTAELQPLPWETSDTLSLHG